MSLASRINGCSTLLLAAVAALVGAAGIVRPASAAPEEVAAVLAAPGAWAYVDASGEVRPSGSFTGVPPESSLTAAGVEARQSFDFRTGDPVLGCGEPGMPRALTAASPMTFAWDGNDLVIRYESMDVERRVHMTTAAVPPGTPRTPNGYARGAWEDDTLVIRTSHLDGRVQDLLGTPKSEAMTLEERYVVDEAGGAPRMHVDLIMTDVTVFTEPYVWQFDFVLEPDWALLEYACEERPANLTPGALRED